MFKADHTFTDAKGREIAFEIGEDITAHVAGAQVGSVEFDEDEDGNAHLFNMHVEPEYQRSGIATEMIRLAAGEHGRRFGRPSYAALGGLGKASSSYFTTDGASLIQHCVRLGIIDEVSDYGDEPPGSDDWDEDS